MSFKHMEKCDQFHTTQNIHRILKKYIKLMKYDFLYFRLSSLQHLSVANNQLIELPVEMCALIRLEEFHVAGNQLTSLPLEFGFLVNLEKLYLQKNKIRELPEVLKYLFLFEIISPPSLSSKFE